MQTDEFILQAVKEVDVNRLPLGVRESAEALLTTWAAQYGIQRPMALNQRRVQNLGDDSYRLMDDGYWIVMYHNGHGSITAVALGESESDTINDLRECIEECVEDEDRIAVHDSPTRALDTLVEQMKPNT